MITNPYALSILRHLLSGVGAVLVSHGIIAPESVDGFISGNVELLTGVTMYVVSQVASLLEKKQKA